MNKYKLILQSLDLIIEHALWPEKKPSEIFNILMYVNEKGWLYTPNKEGKIVAIVCAYRIQNTEGDSLTKMPLEESGNILYVPFVIVIEKNVNLFHVIRESCKMYLKDNPDIEKIVLEDKNNNIKEYNLKVPQGV